MPPEVGKEFDERIFDAYWDYWCAIDGDESTEDSIQPNKSTYNSTKSKQQRFRNATFKGAVLHIIGDYRRR